MNEDRKSNRPGEADPGEPADLSEVRAARALAQALEGGEPAGEPQLLEALEAAALIASARAPELSDEARERIAGELFGHAPPARSSAVASRRRLAWFGTGAAAAAALGLGLFALQPAPRMAPAPAEPSQARLLPPRGEAEALLAALLPPGGSPAGRAERLAGEAAARLRGLPAEGRP